MNQCVPSWDLYENPTPPTPRLNLPAHSNSLAHDVPTSHGLDYEVTELTWENGQLTMHGLGLPRLPSKSLWDTKPLAAGDTLESLVNQASTLPHRKSIGEGDGGRDVLVPWFKDHHHRCEITKPATTASIAMTMDALVPCNNTNNNSRNNQETSSTDVLESVPAIGGTYLVGCSTHAGSCSGAPTLERDARLARVAHEWSSRADQSASGSAASRLRDSRQVTLDACDREFGTPGFTSTSSGSPGNTSSAKQCTKTVDDHDSVCHSRNQREGGDEDNKKKGTGKVSVLTKRSRPAAIHNQSERKRRDKINQRMKTLQKLVPNSSKTDKASMLDEVIEYLKNLQAQIQLMSRMNMSPMMLPLAMQQQLQMPMIGQLGMGMNLGMGFGVMDMNTIGRPNITGIPPVLHPSAFMPINPWDIPGDRLAPSASAMPDPLSAAFLACQSQPMTIDAYSRMATLYQQFQQPPGPASKTK